MGGIINKTAYKRTNFEFLFILGLLFIPFDNLFFAPSTGWATIAPFFFLGYSIINYKKCFKLINRKIFLAAFLLLSYTSFKGIILSSFLGVVETLGTLFLGVSCYFSFCIFENAHKDRTGKIICKYLFIAYSISFIYGLISLIPSSSIDNILQILEKRYYSRLHFSFTEPSFVSMHIFGVMLPLSLYFKNKRLRNLGILFLITTLIFGESARFLFDTFVVFSIYVAYLLFKKNPKYLLLFIILMCICIPFLYYYLNSGGGRIARIFQLGVYSDNSFAARWFRINAIVHGFDLQHIFTGYGLGSTWIPFNNGYDIAFDLYKNGYLVEVLAIKGSHSTSYFCLPLRVISEFGLLAFLYFIGKMYKKKNWYYFLVIVWLYVQFDSYAFYALWIYLFINRRNKGGILD